MSEELLISVSGQLGDVLKALLLGCCVGLYYDFWRLLRMMRDFSRLSVFLQDMIFWLTSAVFVFFAVIKINAGFVRLYFITLIFVAWLLYYFTVGNVIMFTGKIAVRSIKKLFYGLNKCIVHPLYRSIVGIFMLISQKSAKIFTLITKKSQIHKKC